MTTNTSASEQHEVTAILTEDHQEMLDLIDVIKQATDAKTRRDTADTVIAEVMRHSVAEEMFVYPAMEKHLPRGKDEVEHDKEEHEGLIDVMKRLEDVDAEDDNFMDLVHELESQLRHHVSDEEDEQFPKLREHISVEERQEMGQQVEQAKRVAPTRPHPNAPHAELFHKTIGAGVGMVDRLRDKLTGRQTEQ